MNPYPKHKRRSKRLAGTSPTGTRLGTVGDLLGLDHTLNGIRKVEYYARFELSREIVQLRVCSCHASASTSTAMWGVVAQQTILEGSLLTYYGGTNYPGGIPANAPQTHQYTWGGFAPSKEAVEEKFYGSQTIRASKQGIVGIQSADVLSNSSSCEVGTVGILKEGMEGVLWASLVNSAFKRKDMTANCRLEHIGRLRGNSLVALYATRIIRKEEELLLNYVPAELHESVAERNGKKPMSDV